MAHLGLTPQSVHAFGGYRVQGRGEDGEQLLQDAKTLEAAGAFAVVLECVPTPLAARVTEALSIPTIGIGAGPDCDAQVLVWQDMAPVAADAKVRPPVRRRRFGAARRGHRLRPGRQVRQLPRPGRVLPLTRAVPGPV